MAALGRESGHKPTTGWFSMREGWVVLLAGGVDLVLMVGGADGGWWVVLMVGGIDLVLMVGGADGGWRVVLMVGGVDLVLADGGWC